MGFEKLAVLAVWNPRNTIIIRGEVSLMRNTSVVKVSQALLQKYPLDGLFQRRTQSEIVIEKTSEPNDPDDPEDQIADDLSGSDGVILHKDFCACLYTPRMFRFTNQPYTVLLLSEDHSCVSGGLMLGQVPWITVICSYGDDTSSAQSKTDALTETELPDEAKIERSITRFVGRLRS